LSAAGYKVSDAIELSANLLAYLIGNEFMNEEQRTNLRNEWNRARGKELDAEKLARVADDVRKDVTPEDLRRRLVEPIPG
jgi:hypothetical protein